MAWYCCRPPDPARQMSNALQKQIKMWFKDYDKSIKILLLGAGESGKTTVLKQMKILHENGYSEAEKMEKVIEIRQNILQSLLEIIEIMPKLHPCSVLEKTENQKSVDFMQNLRDRIVTEFSQEFFNHAIALWNDSGIQDSLSRAHQFPLLDCTKYLFSRIDAIRAIDYLPSNQDILHSRKRTLDIQKVEFTIKVPRKFGGGSQLFWMFDVGGQRSERKKWIQVFEGISAVLFVIACNNFDSHIREDIETNSLKESLELFDLIWNSRFLKDSGIILFLNKQDLLKEKVNNGISISKYFEEFNDYKVSEKERTKHCDEYIRSRCFIRDKFLEIAKRRDNSNSGHFPDYSAGKKIERQCFWHYTVATDTNNINRVFSDVHTMIVMHNFNQVTPT